MIGESLSHFKVVSRLGQGGMGVVYRGVDLDLDRPVAIKILPPESQQDEDSIGRFLREAKTASKLQHPAITTIYEFGVKDQLRYLVMEYIEGKTLRDLLASGPLTLRQALDIGIQAADAMVVAGEKGIIHRDLKPENIMVTERGQVKILDFGLAKMVEKSGKVPAPDDFKTSGNLVLGTARYMSPEQALGAELDARSDIFSLGGVLFEMVTGKAPFTGTSPQVVLAKILNQPPPSPSDFRSDLPPALERVVLKCLEKDRANRYQSALQLLAELKNQKQHLESEQGWGSTMVASPASLGMSNADMAGTERLQELIPSGPHTGSAASRQPSGQINKTVVSAALAERIGSTGAQRPMVSPNEKAMRQRGLTAARWFRRIFSLAAGAYILSLLFIFCTPLLKAERLADFAFVQWIHRAVDPLLTFVIELVSFDFSAGKFNFLPAGLAVVVYILQQIISGRLLSLEAWIEKPLLEGTKGGSLHAVAGALQAAGTTGALDASRMSLLRQYAAAKKVLGEARRNMAFLSIDVAGSTRMKSGEDKLVIEHAFSEYKKFLERIFREFRVYKVAWTPDGVMTAFPSPDDAAGAARKVLKELEWFNRDVHQMKTKFEVRCGLNFGEVMIPDEKPLEEISDQSIDVAGHLQKYAEKNELWISAEVYTRLSDTSGYVQVDRQVDNHEVYSFRCPSPS